MMGRPHQDLTLDSIMDRRDAMLAMEMGTGKALDDDTDTCMGRDGDEHRGERMTDWEPYPAA